MLEFYEYIRPRKFEHYMRQQLVSNLQAAMTASVQFRYATVFPFGSFVTSLYLPTSDMDLVICNQAGRPPMIGQKWLWKFRSFLEDCRLCAPGSIEVIGKAKVPLVKYIDRSTGLSVDVSFENMSGVLACNTFAHWQTLYPDMPLLVSVIKHYLAMRGLNEPVNGGIGGTSVICLVVSLLQHRPKTQSEFGLAPTYLGQLLMEFLQFYGHKFDYRNIAIVMNPPQLIPKVFISFSFSHSAVLLTSDPRLLAVRPRMLIAVSDSTDHSFT